MMPTATSACTNAARKAIDDAAPDALLVGDEIGGDHHLAVARPGGVHDAVEERDAAEPPEGAAVASAPFSAAVRSRLNAVCSAAIRAVQPAEAGAAAAARLAAARSRCAACAATARRRPAQRRRGGQRGQVAGRARLRQPSRGCRRRRALRRRSRDVGPPQLISALFSMPAGQRLHVGRQLALVGADRRRAPRRPPRRAPAPGWTASRQPAGASTSRTASALGSEKAM